MYKTFKLFITSSIVLFSLGSLTPTTVSASAIKQTTRKPGHTYSKLKKINQVLLTKLIDFQTNFKVTAKHKNDFETDWAKFIKNIHYLKNNQIEIYTTDDFQKLNSTNRQTVINSTQRFSVSIIDQYQEQSESTFLDGLPALIFGHGNYLGRSEYLNNKEFIWNK